LTIRNRLPQDNGRRVVVAGRDDWLSRFYRPQRPVYCVRRADGKLHEKNLAVIERVKDECKAQAIDPCAPKK